MVFIVQISRTASQSADPCLLVRKYHYGIAYCTHRGIVGIVALESLAVPSIPSICTISNTIMGLRVHGEQAAVRLRCADKREARSRRRSGSWSRGQRSPRPKRRRWSIRGMEPCMLSLTPR